MEGKGKKEDVLSMLAFAEENTITARGLLLWGFKQLPRSV